ncbi:hypothetical protein V2K56_26445, partial [Pseudomonas alliivorans]|nr:hypothetical protein [Pseudomonas alliivorans]
GTARQKCHSKPLTHRLAGGVYGSHTLQAQSDAMELKAQQGAKITSADIGIGIGIGKQDEGGEGTVPTLSGQAPTAHIKFSANLKGFAHGTSYDNKLVRAVTAHFMISIAKRAKTYADHTTKRKLLIHSLRLYCHISTYVYVIQQRGTQKNPRH